MDPHPDHVSDEDDFSQALGEAAREVIEPIAYRGRTMLGITRVALVGAPLLIILTMGWAFLAGPVIDFVFPPGGGTAALSLVLAFGPPLVGLFLILRWLLFHSPPNVRRFFTI